MASRHRFNPDRWAIVLIVTAALVFTGWRWLTEHPEHNPWVPLRLSDRVGWATVRKLAHLRAEPDECRAFLKRSAIAFTALPPVGEGICRRVDRVAPTPDAASGLALRPTGAQASCAVSAALALWLRHSVQPAARDLLHTRVVAIEHLGTNNCRRIGGGATGAWSEHATGNAIDVAGFVLADGRRVSVLRDWSRPVPEADFLRAARKAACQVFATTLSPDYNAAHRDHLHLDQAARHGFGVCR
ncbi:extensin family protein [Novosphingobium sp. PS1R-30]|uniref:Extensin family protein n=1 Tax=Novosphingobium anseongense TaxID=3133436 RepID=A0ABU8RRL8_9SPHN